MNMSEVKKELLIGGSKDRNKEIFRMLVKMITTRDSDY